MSENLGDLEVQLTLSNKQLENNAKKSINTINKLENSMNSLRVHGEKLTKSLDATPMQSKNLKAIAEGYKNQRRELKLAGEQQATFNDLIKAGVTSNEAYNIALGHESKQHEEIIKVIKKERNAVNELRKAKASEQSLKDEKKAKAQAKTEVDQNIQKNIAAMQTQQRILSLTATQQRHYNAMVKAGIPPTDALKASTGKLSKAYQKEANTVKRLSNETAKMNQRNTNLISKNAKKQKKSFEGVANGLGLLVNPYTMAAAGIGAVAFAAVKLGKAVISVNATIENAGVKWEVLLGGMADAQDRMAELQSFAAKTPFKFEGISKASTILQSFGGDNLATGKSLEKLGDMAALAQRPIGELALHYGRMYDAIQAGRPFGESALRMQELGLMSGKTGNELTRMRKKGAEANEMWAVFMKSTEHADGLMAKLSKTWDGLSSTLADNLRIIFQEGSKPLFDEMKDDLEGLLSFVITNKDTITNWLKDWFTGVAKIVDVTAELTGYLAESAIWWAKLTNSDSDMEKLTKQSLAYGESIRGIESQLKDAKKSQEAYNKLGDSSLAKQVGLNISAYERQIDALKKSQSQTDAQIVSLSRLGMAEKKLSEARAARRKREEEAKKREEAEAARLRKIADANKKVSDSIVKTIEDYDNKVRAMRLVGEEQVLFNELLSDGIKGEKAFQIAMSGNADIHKKNISALQGSIAAHEKMKKILDDAKKAGDAKVAIDKGMSNTIKSLTSDINNQTNKLSATKQELQQYNDIMKTGISSAQAWKFVNSENTAEYQKQIAAIKVLSNELAILNQPKEATFDEKMVKFFDDMRKQADDTALLVQGVFTTTFDNIGDAMSNAIINGKFEWDDMFKSMFADMTRMLVKQGQNKLMSSLGGSIFGTAAGGVSAFANGGVVNSPTMFPMGSGKTGLMGEAGKEAIMPLERVGGKLGVRSSGGDTGNKTININVTAPDGNLSRPSLDQVSSAARNFLGV